MPADFHLPAWESCDRSQQKPSEDCRSQRVQEHNRFSPNNHACEQMVIVHQLSACSGFLAQTIADTSHPFRLATPKSDIPSQGSSVDKRWNGDCFGMNRYGKNPGVLPSILRPMGYLSLTVKPSSWRLRQCLMKDEQGYGLERETRRSIFPAEKDPSTSSFLKCSIGKLSTLGIPDMFNRQFICVCVFG